MAEPLLLALDQGTTSTRAILFDAKGQVLAEAGRPLEQFYPADGWVEHDAEEIFAASVAVLREALEKAGGGASDVAAIGVTNQRETVVIWDKATGKPIHRAIVWQDRRTAATCERLRAAGPGSRNWPRARARITAWCWCRPSPAWGRPGGTPAPAAPSSA